jgi:hypothetical protein
MALGLARRVDRAGLVGAQGRHALNSGGGGGAVALGLRDSCGNPGGGSVDRRLRHTGFAEGTVLCFALVETVLQPPPPLHQFIATTFEPAAARFAGNAGFSHLLQADLRGGKFGGRAFESGVCRLTCLLITAFAAFERPSLVGEPRHCRVGVGDMLVLTRDITGELVAASSGFLSCGGDARQLLVQRLAGVIEAMQRRRCRGFGEAQWRQCFLGRSSMPAGGGGMLGRGSDGAVRRAPFE